jgi:hypothetical protein
MQNAQCELRMNGNESHHSVDMLEVIY